MSSVHRIRLCANRRLYNLTAKTYTTLQEVAALAQQPGAEVTVLDTNDVDVTALTLFKAYAARVETGQVELTVAQVLKLLDS